MNGVADRVLIIGLDCAEPSLVFDRWRNELPNLSRLMEQGTWTTMNSTTPPITVPAWSCMMASKDPGTLGIYGFRNRKDYSYGALTFATSTAVKEPRLWEILGRAGKQSVVIGVPGTYPPTPVHGVMVSCFLTPDPARNAYTYPPSLRDEIDALLGKNQYMVDVTDYRTENKQAVLDEIYQMTDRRFRLARHWLRSRTWDFFVLVEMGVDRIHHAFWKYFDPQHRKYVPGSPFANAIRDYYVHVDRLIGELLDGLPARTGVMVVSDHGGKRIDGGIAINEWLVREGYLVLQGDYPSVPTPPAKLAVDWTRTRVWSEGGYYARVFINRQGREPQGVVSADQYESLREELIRKLETLGDESGRPTGTKVYRPEELYRHCHGIAPDLIAIFGDLYWRSIGSVGYRTVHVFENDTGPDDANHAQDAVFIAAGPGVPAGRRAPVDLLDVAPTVLRWLGQPIPPDMQGRAIF
jgi:predicted AlkP superfamily phosphohydrolase/phosphomutase